jgi:Ca2+-binding RTX toxin-like protein
MGIFHGNNANNNLIGSDVADTLYGYGANDVLRGGFGADTLDGGADRDYADYSDSNVGVFVSLVTGRGDNGTAEGDRLISIEGLMGSNHDDWLIGDDVLGNTLYGRDGDDALKGGGGDDFLYGGAGGDVLDGGEGVDLVSYYDSGVGVVISLIGDTASGGTATGDNLDNIENVYGSYHADQIRGDDGVNLLQGQRGRDTLWGYGGDDTLNGNEDNDTVYGMANDDTLYGGNGNDTLDGGTGIDTLIGQTGTDTLTGGGDGDFFEFHGIADTSVTFETMDRIMDFNFAAGDRIDLRRIDADVYAGGDQMFDFNGTADFTRRADGTYVPGEINYYYSGGDTVIQMQTGTSADIEGGIRLAGIHTVDDSWFIL